MNDGVVPESLLESDTCMKNENGSFLRIKLLQKVLTMHLVASSVLLIGLHVL